MSAALCLELGDVLLLQCTHCNPPKPKFYVVVQVQPLWLFFINSELTDLQKRDPSRTACNPIIRGDEHTFLKYDSYLGCDHISREHSYESAEKILNTEPDRKVGSISARCREALAQALIGNEHLAGKALKILRGLWGVPRQGHR